MSKAHCAQKCNASNHMVESARLSCISTNLESSDADAGADADVDAGADTDADADADADAGADTDADATE